MKRLTQFSRHVCSLRSTAEPEILLAAMHFVQHMDVSECTSVAVLVSITEHEEEKEEKKEYVKREEDGKGDGVREEGVIGARQERNRGGGGHTLLEFGLLPLVLQKLLQLLLVRVVEVRHGGLCGFDGLGGGVHFLWVW